MTQQDLGFVAKWMECQRKFEGTANTKFSVRKINLYSFVSGIKLFEGMFDRNPTFNVYHGV